MHRNPCIKVSAVVLTNDGGDVALVRKHATQAFIFPGGKPEAGETGLEAAVREVHEELGVVLDPHLVHHVADYTTPAANEADTELLSQVYRAHLPTGQHVAAQAEIAQLIWLDPAALELPAGYRLAPLSSLVLQELAHGSVR